MIAIVGQPTSNGYFCPEFTKIVFAGGITQRVRCSSYDRVFLFRPTAARSIIGEMIQKNGRRGESHPGPGARKKLHRNRYRCDRHITRVTQWKGPPGKRRRGRPLTGWEEDLKRSAGSDWCVTNNKVIKTVAITVRQRCCLTGFVLLNVDSTTTGRSRPMSFSDDVTRLDDVTAFGRRHCVWTTSLRLDDVIALGRRHCAWTM
ncbi:hypothetical protein EVAR_83332_1 [Eumeta japonica]|uniref:Uncharacterized protein n=1 Tax=Eumeta variegata TaxID=151549 RepID=A0A4C1VVN2_EUMVA|nr:hypothetical protein EVAR_83332_1 [Eumeta japonica]